MSRVVAAARLHAIHAPVALGVPWLVVGSSFAINLAIWAAMSPEARAAGGTGGLGGVQLRDLHPRSSNGAFGPRFHGA